MASHARSDENDLLAALGHPLRRSILRQMAGGGATSPRQLAARLRRPLGNVSYHVRVLAERGAIAPAGTKPSHGSIEHFYRIAVEAPWALQVLGSGGKMAPGGESPPGAGT